MNKQYLQELESVGRQRTDALTRSPKDARAFMIRAGIYTKAGKLKANYGGAQTTASRDHVRKSMLDRGNGSETPFTMAL
jgi:hypothetical protein